MLWTLVEVQLFSSCSEDCCSEIVTGALQWWSLAWWFPIHL